MRRTGEEAVLEGGEEIKRSLNALIWDFKTFSGETSHVIGYAQWRDGGQG